MLKSPKRRRTQRKSFRKLAAERLEVRHLLSVDAVQQNPIQALDVDADAFVSPIDALIAINEINRRSKDPNSPIESGNFVDVSGDGSLSPIDALLVVNILNNQQPTLGAKLALDSGPNNLSNFDLLTNNYGLEFGISNPVPGLRIEGRINAAGNEAFQDVTDLLATATLTLSEPSIDALAGEKLGDGLHKFEFRLPQGEVIDFEVTIDRQAPTAMIDIEALERVTFDRFEIQSNETLAVNADNLLLRVEGGPQDGQTIAIDAIEAVEASTVRVHLASSLADQGYRIQVNPLQDLAGNQADALAKSFMVADPTGIQQISPRSGEELVSVVRETIVRFDEPIDPSTITTSSFQVIANGGPVAGRIAVSRTDRFATFFYDQPLPPSTEVRVKLDGAAILGRDGLAVDADGDDLPGGTFAAAFRTLPLTRIPGTDVFGFVRDSMTGQPIEGVTIRVDAFPQANAVTDANGRFELEDMPAPEFFVHVDGTTATNLQAGFTYPNVGKPFHSVPGQQVQLEMSGEAFDIYLPLQAIDDAVLLSNTEVTSVGFGEVGKSVLATMFPDADPAIFDAMSVSIEPGAAIDSSGTAATQASIIPVPPDRLPAPLPPNQNPGLVVSIQAGSNFGDPRRTRRASRFDIPARVTFPNVDNLVIGEKTLISSFDHAAGEWKVVGTGTVINTGQFDIRGVALTAIQSDGGVIQSPGWHYSQPGVQVGINLNLPWQDDLQNARESFLGKFNKGLERTFTRAMGIGAEIDPFLIKEANRFVKAVSFANKMKSCEFRGQYPSCWDVLFVEALDGIGKLTQIPIVKNLGKLVKTVDAVTGEIRFQREFNKALEDFRNARLAAAEHMKLIEGIKDALEELQQINDDIRGSLQEMGTTLQRMSQELDDFERTANAILDEISHTLEGLNLSNPADQQAFGDRLETGPNGEPANSTEIVLPPTPIIPPDVTASPEVPPIGTPGEQPPDIADILDKRDDENRPIVIVPTPKQTANDAGDTFQTATVLTVATDGGVAVDHLLGDNELNANDVDVFRFSANTGDTIAVDVRRLQPSLAFSYVRLFDEDGRQLATDSQTGLGLNPQIPYFEIPADGEYYLAMSSARNNAYDPNLRGSGADGNYEGAYRLSIRRWQGTVANRTRVDQALFDFLLSAKAVQTSSDEQFYARPDQIFNDILSLRDTFAEITTMPLDHPAFISVGEADGNIILRGITDLDGRFTTVVAANTSYELFAYDPVHDLTFSTPFFAGESGTRVEIRSAVLGSDEFTDGDRDKLSDTAEFALGTNVDDTDSDRDGINDFEEVQRGLDPLGGRAFPTGRIATLPLFGQAKEVTLEAKADSQGQTAYIATGSHGLAVVDASQFNNPIVLGQLDLAGDATDIGVDTRLSLAALAAKNGGIHLVDVSDPMLPSLVKTLGVNSGRIEVIDGVIYAAVGSEIRSYSLLNGELLEVLDLSGSTLRDIAREGSFLYTMDSSRNLQVVDMSGDFLHQRDSLKLSNGNGKIFAHNGIVYAAASDNGLGGFVTVDVSDPDSLEEISSTLAPQESGPGTDVLVNGSGLAILVGRATRQSGDPALLQLVRLNSLVPPDQEYLVVPRIELPTAPFDVTLASGIAYVAGGSAGLHVVNYLPFDAFGVAPQVSITGQAADVDSVREGIQVFEGSRIAVRPDLADDVQVGSVALLVNGEVVLRDVSTPFDFTFTAPSLQQATSELVVSVRAMDTGGNATQSNELRFEIVPDTTPPRIESVLPAAETRLRAGHPQVFELLFSEPLDPTTASGSTIRLVSAGADTEFNTADDTLLPLAIELDRRGTRLRINTDALSTGRHQLQLTSEALADRAGNPLATTLITMNYEVVPGTLLVHNYDNGALYTVDPATGEQTLVSETLQLMYDIAFHESHGLWGIDDSSKLFRINASTGATELISDLRFLQINGLSFRADGQLFGSNLSGRIYRINLETGQAHEVFDSRYVSAGDIQFDNDGLLYMTADNGSQSTRLVVIDLIEGTEAVVGNMGPVGRVLGISRVSDGRWIGVTESATLVEVNIETGEATLVAELVDGPATKPGGATLFIR